MGEGGAGDKGISPSEPQGSEDPRRKYCWYLRRAMAQPLLIAIRAHGWKAITPNDVDCPVIWKFRGEKTISRSRNPRASLIEAKTEIFIALRILDEMRSSAFRPFATQPPSIEEHRNMRLRLVRSRQIGHK
jgi:hypothetical protein